MRRILIAMNGKKETQMLLATVAVLLLTAAVAGQRRGGGSIRGSIKDVNGAPIASAKVVVSCNESGENFATTSSADGNFELANLPDGVFTGSIEAPGFAGVSNRTIRVRAGKPAELQEVLEAGGSGEGSEDVAALKRRIDGLEAQNRDLANQNRAIMQSLAELKTRLDRPGE